MAVFRKIHFILCVVAGITAIEVPAPPDDPKVQVIRIGDVGSGFAQIQGFLIPKGYDSVVGVPNYEFRSTINGVPVQDKEFIQCRCDVLYRYESPISPSKPVLLCRGTDKNKGSQSQEKMAFLFAAESLELGEEVKGINLLMGRTTWKNVVATHASAATAAPGGGLRGDLPW